MRAGERDASRSRRRTKQRQINANRRAEILTQYHRLETEAQRLTKEANRLAGEADAIPPPAPLRVARLRVEADGELVFEAETDEQWRRRADLRELLDHLEHQIAGAELRADISQRDLMVAMTQKQNAAAAAMDLGRWGHRAQAGLGALNVLIELAVGFRTGGTRGLLLTAVLRGVDGVFTAMGSDRPAELAATDAILNIQRAAVEAREMMDANEERLAELAALPLPGWDDLLRIQAEPALPETAAIAGEPGGAISEAAWNGCPVAVQAGRGLFWEKLPALAGKLELATPVAEAVEAAGKPTYRQALANTVGSLKRIAAVSDYRQAIWEQLPTSARQEFTNGAAGALITFVLRKLQSMAARKILDQEQSVWADYLDKELEVAFRLKLTAYDQAVLRALQTEAQGVRDELSRLAVAGDEAQGYAIPLDRPFPADAELLITVELREPGDQPISVRIASHPAEPGGQLPELRYFGLPSGTLTEHQDDTRLAIYLSPAAPTPR